MISSDLVRLMAAYNHWQNTSLYDAASSLTDAERKQDCGAFFGSIHATLAHIVWADQIWLSRFGGCDAPEGGIASSVSRFEDWPDLVSIRQIVDTQISDWATGLTDADLAGDFAWFSGAKQADTTRPVWILVQHMFNHQTHHRGQVHAMLTRTGARPDDTDLFMMPELSS